jgi:hypothetical protein
VTQQGYNPFPLPQTEQDYAARRAGLLLAIKRKKREACAATFAVVDGVLGASVAERQLSMQLYGLEDALRELDWEWADRAKTG